MKQPATLRLYSLATAALIGFGVAVVLTSESPDPIQAVHILSAKDHPFVGTVWRVEGGLFVTALHVPTDEEMIQVDGRPAEVLAIDEDHDLCVLRVPDLDGPCLTLGLPVVGEEARCVGFVGTDGFGYRMQTYGHVTSLSLPGGWVGYDGGLQPGLSGSPVLDRCGCVVGVASRCQTWSAFGAPNASMSRLGSVAALRRLLASTDPNGPALPVPKTPAAAPAVSFTLPFTMPGLPLFGREPCQPEESVP